MTTTALNKTSVQYLTNKSGGDLAYGSVVILDSSNASAFTTTSTAAYTAGTVGVVLDTAGILNNATGAVAIGGYIPKVLLTGSASLHDTFGTSTTPGQGVSHASVIAGDVGQVLNTGSSPDAIMWGGAPSGGGGSGPATGVVVHLTNNSGGHMSQGAVGYVNNVNPHSVYGTNTHALSTATMVVVADVAGIDDGNMGNFAVGGYVPVINLDNSANLGDLFCSSTSLGQATPHAAPVTTGDFGQVLGTGTTPDATLWGGAPVQQGYPYILIKELQSPGTSAGSAATHSFISRNINTVEVDTNGLVISLAGGVLTLSPGTYRVDATVPSYNSGTTQAFLWAVNDNSSIIAGTSDYGGVGTDITTHSRIVGQFVWANTDILAIEQIFYGWSPDPDCLGKAVNSGFGEVYTIVQLWKVG